MTRQSAGIVVQPQAEPRLRVGVHGNNLHLRLARIIAALRGDERFDFIDHADGRETGALIGSDVIDVGGTGSTPPLAAASKGLEIAYLAASLPRPANGAVVVRDDGSVAGLNDLVGRRIALIEGSFHTYLLAHLAEQAGLRLADFERIDLSPADSARALRQGRVEAWIAMDPHLPAEIREGGVAALAGSAGVVPNRSLFWTSRAIAAAKQSQISALLTLLSSVAPFLSEQPEAAAASLAQAGDATVAQWLGVLRSRDWSLVDIDATILGEQQREADMLARHGVLRAAPICEHELSTP